MDDRPKPPGEILDHYRVSDEAARPGIGAGPPESDRTRELMER